MTGPAPLVELIAGIVVIAIGVLIVRFADRIAAGMRRIRQAAARTPDVASESPVLVRAVAIGWLLLGGLLVVFGIGGLAGS